MSTTTTAGGFAPLRFMRAGVTVVLGLVSSKTPSLEPADALRRRIDEGGNLLSPAAEFAKLKLVADVAQVTGAAND